MRFTRFLALSLAVVVASTTGAAPVQEEPLLLVACAPGYPGTTAQAQPTMDRFARLVAEAAGFPSDRLIGEYQRDERVGVERIRAAGDIVVVPLPFFLAHEEALDLRPVVQTVSLSGQEHESWSLVAATGRVQAPPDLAGWEILGTPAYAPAFVHGLLLGDWGTLPPDVSLSFSRNVLGALRRAAAGEPVAVLLDGEQSAALSSLPMAEQLQVVARSPEWIPALVASVGDAIDTDHFARLRDGLLRVHEIESFAELLTTLRLSRFAPLDVEALGQARERYRAAS